eukprot:s857_g16.t1
MSHVTSAEPFYDLISGYDCDSSLGCLAFPMRTNLLVEVNKRNFIDDQLSLEFSHYIPEGFGLQAFDQEHLMVPSDACMNDTLTLIWQIQDALPPMHTKIWLFQVSADEWDVTKFHFDLSASWGYASSFPRSNPQVHHLEMFSGGMGGWTTALRFLSGFHQKPVRTFGLEIEPEIARTFALNHNAAMVIPPKDLPEEFFLQFEGNWIICDDVLSNKWLKAISREGIDVVTISSPCGPWSTASHALGLEKPEGALMLHAILKCRFLRPTYICMENVSGFAAHCQKPIIERAIRWIGYRIQWQRTVDVKTCLGVHRSRWLAVAVRVHAPIPVPSFVQWSLPAATQTDHTPSCLAWDEHVLRQLSVTDVMHTTASAPQNAGRFAKNKTPQEIFQQRLVGFNQVLPTFMAKYGSQHDLPPNYLAEHAYLGFFLKQPDLPHGARLFHPAEIALIHGALDWLYVPSDLTLAWLVTGNCILPLHAMLPLATVMSAFSGRSVDMSEAVDTFLRQRLNKYDLLRTPVGVGTIYTKQDVIPMASLVDSIDSLFALTADDGVLQVWIPQVGVVHAQTHSIQNTQLDEPQVACSAISVASSAESPEHLVAVLCAHVHLGMNRQQIWFASDLPAHALEAPWFHHFQCHYSDLASSHEGTSLRLRDDVHGLSNPTPGHLLQVLVDQQLTLLCSDPLMPIKDHPDVIGLTPQLYDQFGLLHDHQKPDDFTAVFDQQLMHGKYAGGAVRLFAAFETTLASQQWDHSQDFLMLNYQGVSTCLKVIAEFWEIVMPPATQEVLGRKVACQQSPGSLQICISPQRDHGVLPPNSFAIALSVLAFRTLLEVVCQPYDHFPKKRILLKWLCRPLWFNDVPNEVTMGLIIRVLHHALLPANGSAQHRVIYNAKQVMPETMMATLTAKPDKLAVVLHVILQITGGGGAKHQQRVLQQTALATYLLEQGYDLRWVTQTVDALCDKFSLQKISQVTAMPVGSSKFQALQTLLKEANIDIPVPSKQQTRKVPVGLPWNQPKKRRSDGDVDPTEYALVEGFFQNQDQSFCQQLSNLRPQASGVCMLTSAQAEPWLASTEKLSSDELALLVVGKPPVSSVSGTEVVVPCTNLDHQMVLIHCMLYQLGAKAVTYKTGDPAQVAADKCALVALTLHKDDFSADHWQDAIQRTVPFIRGVLDNDGLADHVLSIWGRSFRQGKTPCSPMQAQTLQVHCSVPDDKLPKMLSKSGFNKLFCTPKCADGRLDTTYQVLWMSDPCQAAIFSAKVSNSLGLVKGRKSLGLRFRQQDFEPAWQVLCPNLPVPSKPTGDKVFRVDGLPFGVTTTMIEQWAAKIGWKCQPMRTLGPQGMLIRADDMPPPGITMFNSHPVLIRLLPPRGEQNATKLVGPKASRTKDTVKEGIPDPWAKWQGPRPMATPTPVSVSRTTDGPTETRLAAQDRKIDGLEQQLKSVVQAQENMAKQTEARFQAAEEREKKHHEHVTKSMDSVKKELARSLDNAFNRNNQMMDDRLNELKQLLLTSNKRPPPGDGSMED